MLCIKAHTESRGELITYTHRTDTQSQKAPSWNEGGTDRQRPEALLTSSMRVNLRDRSGMAKGGAHDSKIACSDASIRWLTTTHNNTAYTSNPTPNPNPNIPERS